MNLTEMIVEIRLEIQEAVESVFLDTELTRAVQKSVSLMSRLIPKRAVVEATLDRDIVNAALTIASSTGTLGYKPVKVDSIVITGEVLDTDYTINYMTGVVTEVGALLADGAYVANYDLDPLMLDIATILPEENYIRVERVEYPAGDDPPTYVKFEVFGEMLRIIERDVVLTSDKHIRIIYLKPWTAPTASVAASLTTALTGTNNDLVFTARTGGVVGNGITITYTDPGTTHTLSVVVTGKDIVITLGYAAGAIISTAANIKTLIDADSDAVVLVSVANAGSNDGTGLVTAMAKTALTGGSDTGVDGDYPEHLDNAVIIGSVGQALIFKAEKYVQSAVGEILLVNAAADSMATPLADINAALDLAVKTAAGGALLAVTAALDKVGTYLETNDAGAGGVDNAKDVLANITDDIADLRTAIETALDASADLLVHVSVNPSAKYYLTQGDDKIITVNDAERVAEKYADYARAAIQIYNGLVAEATVRLSNLRSIIEEAQAWMRMGDSFTAEAAQRLGVVNAYLNEAAQRVAEVNAWAVQADRYVVTSREYLQIAGRYLASGQAKVNEMIVSLGFKPEYYMTKLSSEQFS